MAIASLLGGFLAKSEHILTSGWSRGGYAKTAATTAVTQNGHALNYVDIYVLL